jgi:hypothetical protein
MKSIIKKSNANNKNKLKKRVTFKDHRRRHIKKQTKKIQWGGDITDAEINNLEAKYGKQKIWNEMFYPAKENENEQEKRLQLYDLDEYLTNGIQDVDNAIQNNPGTLFSNRLEILKTGLNTLFDKVHPMLDLTYSNGQPQMQYQPPSENQVSQNPQMQSPLPQDEVPGASFVPGINSFQDSGQQLPNSFNNSIIPSTSLPPPATDAFDSDSVTGNNNDVTALDTTPISEQLLSFQDFDALVKDIETQIVSISCLLLFVLEQKNNQENNEEISKIIQLLKDETESKGMCQETGKMYKKMKDAMILLDDSSASNLDKLLSKIMSQTINYIDFYISIVTKFNESNENINNDIQNEYIQKLNKLKQQLIELTKTDPSIQIDETSQEQSGKLSTFETFIDTILLAFTSGQILVGGKKKKTKKRNIRIYKRRQTKRNKKKQKNKRQKK